MTVPPPPAGLQRIKHVVVLMLENRSFDNLLGWLYDTAPPARGQPFEGLNRGLWNPLDNIDLDGVAFIEKVYVRKNGEPAPGDRSGKPAAPDYSLPAPDPGEGYRSTNYQLFQHHEVAALYPPEPTNSGFVNDYRNAMLYGTYVYGEPPADPRQIMICHTPEQVPVLSTLARQFAVCDQWFASLPSQTLPNRHFVHAATSGGQVNNTPNPHCGARTIFNQIEAAIAEEGRSDLSWAIYAGTKQGAFFSLTRLVMPQLQDKSLDGRFQPIERFYADAAAGTLPSYAFLEPQLTYPSNDQHPPHDIRPGEALIAEVYQAVASSPQWNQTLLIITYDEHGGCYDHFPPPNHATPPDPDAPPGQDGFLFNRFGVRVPTVVVSPWIEAGTVCRPPGRVPFDHTSIIATVRNCLGLKEPLTRRDAAAPDLGCCLSLPAPRTDVPAVTPPALPAPPAPRVNDLHRLIAGICAKLTGREPPAEAELHQFVHECYARLFPPKG